MIVMGSTEMEGALVTILYHSTKVITYSREVGGPLQRLLYSLFSTLPQA